MAFARSNALHPTAAAKAKMGDASFPCDVTVARVNVAAKKQASLGDVAAEWGPVDRADDAATARLAPFDPLTQGLYGLDEHAKVEGELGDRALAMTVAMLGSDLAIYHPILREGGAIWSFPRVGGHVHGGRCGFDDDVRVTVRGRFAEVRVLFAPAQVTMVQVDTGDCDSRVEVCPVMGIAACDGVSECHTSCFAAEWIETLRYYDLTAKTEILVVQKEGTINGFQAEPVLPLVETKIDGTHVELLGCGKTLELLPDGPRD